MVTSDESLPGTSAGARALHSAVFSAEGRLKRTLYVGGLAEEVTRDVLHAAFIPFGDIRTVELPLDRQTGQHRSFGFVEFEEEEDANNAIDNLDQSELYGRVIRVNLARVPRNGGRAAVSSSRPVWADDFFYRKRLAEEGLSVDDAALIENDDIEPAESTEVTIAKEIK